MQESAGNERAEVPPLFFILFTLALIGACQLLELPVELARTALRLPSS